MKDGSGAERQGAIMDDLREATDTKTNPAADVLEHEIKSLKLNIDVWSKRADAEEGTAKMLLENIAAAEGRLADLNAVLELITKN